MQRYALVVFGVFAALAMTGCRTPPGLMPIIMSVSGKPLTFLTVKNTGEISTVTGESTGAAVSPPAHDHE